MDPTTGAHINTIERQWREVRAHVPRYGKTKPHFHQFLAEFQFKRKYTSFAERIHEFFLATSELYNPNVKTQYTSFLLFHSLSSIIILTMSFYCTPFTFIAEDEAAENEVKNPMKR